MAKIIMLQKASTNKNSYGSIRMRMLKMLPARISQISSGNKKCIR